MLARIASDTLALASNTVMLGVEASMVVPLRLARLAGGGAPAASELRRMGSEKVEALATLHAAWLRGALGRNPLSLANGTVGHYLKYVRANRKRLTSKRP
jgi:hypothetical protein